MPWTALGYCLIYNATRVVNFAQGDFLSLGGLLLYSLLASAHVPMIPAFALAVAGTALAGALMERLCLKPARSRDLMVLIFITVAASILFDSFSYFTAPVIPSVKLFWKQKKMIAVGIVQMNTPSISTP